jgi:hypothetical protein
MTSSLFNMAHACDTWTQSAPLFHTHCMSLLLVPCSGLCYLIGSAWRCNSDLTFGASQSCIVLLRPRSCVLQYTVLAGMSWPGFLFCL